jgi:hypothetical protein
VPICDVDIKAELTVAPLRTLPRLLRSTSDLAICTNPAPRVAGSVVDFWQDKLHVAHRNHDPSAQVRKKLLQCIESPYSNCPAKTSPGLAQIAVSTPLRTGSIGPGEVLFAEHCRYGTRDLSTMTRRRVNGSESLVFPTIPLMRWSAAAGHR